MLKLVFNPSRFSTTDDSRALVKLVVCSWEIPVKLLMSRREANDNEQIFLNFTSHEDSMSYVERYPYLAVNHSSPDADQQRYAETKDKLEVEGLLHPEGQCSGYEGGTSGIPPQGMIPLDAYVIGRILQEAYRPRARAKASKIEGLKLKEFYVPINQLMCV